jgi:hypothetical protein
MESHETDPNEYFHEQGGLEEKKIREEEGASSPLKKFKGIWSEADLEAEEPDEDEN